MPSHNFGECVIINELARGWFGISLFSGLTKGTVIYLFNV